MSDTPPISFAVVKLAASASVAEPRRWSVGPQLTSSNLNLSRASHPLFGDLSGCTYGYTSTSTSVSTRDPGPGTVRKTSEQTPYGCEGIRSWFVVINVNCGVVWRVLIQ